MLEYMARRVLYIIPTLIGVTFLIFVSVRFIPGDPAKVIAGERARPQLVEQMRERLGLNRPIHEQYAVYMGDLLRGDLGSSLQTNLPLSLEIRRRLPNTLMLAGASLALAAAAGIAAGVVAATRPNTWIDTSGTLLALLGVSMPVFWLGLMLMRLFAVSLPQYLGLSGPLLPPTGSGTWKHMVMPGLTLAAYSTGFIARMTRSAMLEVVSLDFIRTARAKGLSHRVVVYRHGLRNALIPVITVVGLQFGTMLGGAVLTETVFAWQGLGRYLVDAIFDRDYPVIQASVLVIALGFTLINLVVDLAYAVIDPRIRYG